MSVPNGERLATKQDLADMYQEILPYLGGMPEMLANKFSKGDLHSTDEKMIGQWHDGKPLYQRVVEGTLPSTYNDDWHSIYTGDNAMVICDMEFFPQYSYQSSALNDGYFGNGSSNVMSVIFKNNTIYCVISTNGSYMINHPFKAIIRYTKTTDSAISIGNDTDYSTEEKIVGTWIGGEPIYQKTIHTGAFPSNSEKDVAHGISNIENIITYFGFAKRNDNVFSNIPISSNASSALIQTDCNLTNIRLISGYSGASVYIDSYITLQYTKTT